MHAGLQLVQLVPLILRNMGADPSPPHMTLAPLPSAGIPEAKPYQERLCRPTSRSRVQPPLTWGFRQFIDFPHQNINPPTLAELRIINVQTVI